MTAPVSLTPEQQQIFNARVAQLGLSGTDVVGSIETNGRTIIGADPASTLPARTIVVNDLDHLKSLIATTGPAGDSPAPLPADRARLLSGLGGADALKAAFSDDERASIASAINVYALGGQVDPTLVALANAAHFPAEFAAVASGNVIVAAGSPLVMQGSAPVLLTCFLLMIEYNAVIEATTTVIIIADNVVVSASDGIAPNILIRGTPGTNGLSGVGQPNQAASGSQGTASVNDGKNQYCVTAAGPGGSGAGGAAGGNGSNATPGTTAGPFLISAGSLTGVFVIDAAGGSGGTGGAGGTGQQGGTGGAGGASTAAGTSACAAGNGGWGGNGGPGGAGGAGGNGGNGGTVTITGTAKPQTRFVLKTSAAPGGNGGAGGPGGAAGAGGAGTTNGPNGSSGSAGPAGSNGQPGALATMNAPANTV